MIDLEQYNREFFKKMPEFLGFPTARYHTDAEAMGVFVSNLAKWNATEKSKQSVTQKKEFQTYCNYYVADSLELAGYDTFFLTDGRAWKDVHAGLMYDNLLKKNLEVNRREVEECVADELYIAASPGKPNEGHIAIVVGYCALKEDFIVAHQSLDGGIHLLKNAFGSKGFKFFKIQQYIPKTLDELLMSKRYAFVRWFVNRIGKENLVLLESHRGSNTERRMRDSIGVLITPHHRWRSEVDFLCKKGAIESEMARTRFLVNTWNVESLLPQNGNVHIETLPGRENHLVHVRRKYSAIDQTIQNTRNIGHWELLAPYYSKSDEVSEFDQKLSEQEYVSRQQAKDFAAQEAKAAKESRRKETFNKMLLAGSGIIAATTLACVYKKNPMKEMLVEQKRIDLEIARIKKTEKDSKND